MSRALNGEPPQRSLGEPQRLRRWSLTVPVRSDSVFSTPRADVTAGRRDQRGSAALRPVRRAVRLVVFLKRLLAGGIDEFLSLGLSLDCATAPAWAQLKAESRLLRDRLSLTSPDIGIRSRGVRGDASSVGAACPMFPRCNPLADAFEQLVGEQAESTHAQSLMRWYTTVPKPSASTAMITMMRLAFSSHKRLALLGAGCSPPGALAAVELSRRSCAPLLS